MLDDRRKIGAALTGLGVLFMGLGVVLLFDKGLLAMGNIMFLSGVVLILGFQHAGTFLFQKRRLRGTACFLGGIILVLAKYPILGILVEAFGFVNLFGNFFPIIIETLKRMPIIGNVFNSPFVVMITDAVVRRVRPQASRPV
eukprot:c7137_g1_i1.p1 GENE.c7137_g1_i1~~c7137_g1_i1.p1  ORF type:complete len:142 (+),score=22.83 c7137_g1_i1:39-464(+)